MASYSRLKATRVWIKTITVLAMLAGVATIVMAYLASPDPSLAHTLPYLVAGVAFIVLGGLGSGLCDLLIKVEANAHRIHDAVIESRSHQDKLAEMVGVVRDNIQISDAAKSITHRDLERDALRKAIREDILREDWEAAYNLIEEMEKRFGYRVEAYNYRKEVDEFRARVIEDKVESSLNLVRRLVAQGQWTQAQAETDRLLKLAPGDPRVDEALEYVKIKRNEHKRRLLEQWHQAVDQRDVDRGIALLKEIDPFLTREESLQMENDARGIFKAKLLDLGVQFRTAVTERRWHDAIAIGQEIRQGFPNSLMAKEVGDSMDALRSKAAGIPVGSH